MHVNIFYYLYFCTLALDSTATTTEYESANENDIISNRMSSYTDVSCDSSSNVKSFKNSFNEDLHKREVESLFKVSVWKTWFVLSLLIAHSNDYRYQITK